MAEFRGVTPAQRDELAEALGDRITISESPWLSTLLVVFNTKRAAVRRCAGAAGAVARDRPLGRGGAAAGHDLSQICRRGDAAGLQHGDAGRRARHPARLFARHRGGARRGATAAGRSRRARSQADCLVRDIPMPHYAGADLLAESWREIGVTTTQDRRNIWEWQKIVDRGDFDVALDFSGDFYDDPTIQLTKFVSHDLSPVNFSGSHRPLSRCAVYRPGDDHRPAAARQDRARFRAPRVDRGLYGSAVVVEPDRRDLGEAQGLEHHAEPFHRPGSDRCLAGPVTGCGRKAVLAEGATRIAEAQDGSG